MLSFVKIKTIVLILIFLAINIAIAIIFCILNIHYLGNALGFIALVGYTLTLTPSLLRKVFKLKKNPVNNWLFTYRRYIGVATFGFAWNHIAVTINIFDLVDLHQCIEYIIGLSLMFILGLLTFTSNDWSVKILKKDWKKLHQLTYLILLLLPLHILDKMARKWNYFTFIEIFIMASVISLSLVRLLLKFTPKVAD